MKGDTIRRKTRFLRCLIVERVLLAVLVLSALLAPIAASTAAAAKVFRFANNGDLETLDPHSRGENFLNGILLGVFEPLVRRNRDLKLEPALATSWDQTSPTEVRFTLRTSVAFHDGGPFTAEDVVFSISRAKHKSSGLLAYLNSVKEVRRVDNHTVIFETFFPDPVLLDKLSVIGMMSKTWAEQNNAIEPHNIASGTENFATRNANGTGAFTVTGREPGIRTTFAANRQWWDKPEHNLDEVIFTRISNDGTRTAALLTGSIDFVYTAPSPDVARLSSTAGVKVARDVEMRAIFLAMDQARQELLESDVKGRNPFRDVRVRKAIYQAIDVDAIVARVMRRDAQALALPWGPGVNGFDAKLNERAAPYDWQSAKRLLAEAGYPEGFAVTMDCPNDRYINDEATCQATVGMLARIGIKVNLRAQTRSKWFPQILGPNFNTSFALVGWSPQTTYDIHNVIENLLQTRDPSRQKGNINIGGYSNPKLDHLADKMERELNPDLRRKLVAEASAIIRDEYALIPLYAPYVVWAMRSNVDAPLMRDNTLVLRLVRIN